MNASSLQSLRDDPLPSANGRVLRVLSFPGFYHSLLSDALDAEENQLAENIAENHGLDVNDCYTALWDASYYSVGFQHIAQCCGDYYAEMVKPLGIELTFESMTSPREYNFTTDALFLTIANPEALLAAVDQAQFAKVIGEYFTSYDGFHSFYSNDITDWHSKPFDEWDHNELGCLFEAFIRQHADAFEPDINTWLYEGGDFYEAVDKQTDFAALYEALGIEQ